MLNAGVGSSGAVGLGSGPSVGGQRPRNNNFTIEGIDNNSGSVTGPLVTVPNDAVAEFSVQQNQISPEFGHSSGGQFNQVVKSGGNELHGEAYEYLQNRNLNAADNQSALNGDELHPRYDNNRFGGALGGPIKKNKMFFYGLYEYNPIGTSSTPGALLCAHRGRLEHDFFVQFLPGIQPDQLEPVEAVSGHRAHGRCPVDYAQRRLSAGRTGQCRAWAGPRRRPRRRNRSRLARSASTRPPSPTTNPASARSTMNISDKDSLRARFILNRQGTIDTAAALPVFFQTVPTNSYLATLTEFHTFSPTVTNEFRLGYNRYSNVLSAGNYKWPGLDQFPNINVFDLNAQLGPDGNAPQGGIQNQYQLTDNMSWTKGKHSLKFGFDGWKQISPQSFTQRSRGDYEWSYLSDYLFDYNPDYIAQRSLGGAEYYGDRDLHRLLCER